MRLNLDTTIQELFDAKRISVRTYNSLRYAGILTMEDLDNYADVPLKLLNIKNFGKKSYSEVAPLLKEMVHEHKAPTQQPKEGMLAFADDDLQSASVEPIHEEKPQYVLSDVACEYMKNVYEQLRIEQNVRMDNFLDCYAPTFQHLVPFFDEPINNYRRLCPGRALRSSLAILYNFNQKLKSEFQLCQKMDDNELRIAVLKQKFPNLSTAQREFVVEHQRNFGFMPLFFLLYNYMRISEAHCDKIFSLLYGIRDYRLRTQSELADMTGLSRERIRQIVTKRLEVHDTGLIQTEEWKNYSRLLSLPFVTSESSQYKVIDEREHLGLDFRVFARLVQLLGYRDLRKKRKETGNEAKIYTNNYEIVIVGDTSIVINRKKMPTIKISECINSLKLAANTRYPKDMVLTLESFLNSDIAKEEKDHAIALLSYIARETMNLDVINKDEVIIRQNYVDVSEELFHILEQKGKPMPLEEIFEVFKSKYPNHKYEESSRIRQSLYAHPHIKPIGKKSCYGLDSWEDVYYGTIRDLLVKLLEESDEPLQIENIFNLVSEYYPNTSVSSLENSMKVDEYERFLQFKHGYYGLKAKTYDESFEILDIQRQRLSFEERIAEFRDFVDTYKHYPILMNSDKESSLYRWMYNAQHEAVSMNEEQKYELKKIIVRYEKEYIPRNQTEFVFQSKCHDYKKYVDSHHQLPTTSTEPELRGWMTRSKANYDNFIDFRKKYLTDLLDYLRSQGFPI